MAKSHEACEDFTHCPDGDACPLDKECPWCGETSDEPGTYDAWLEAHVAECEPFKIEQGGAS